MTKPRRTEIRKIESREARNVCFSKRRNGLFKKAEELKRLNPNIYITAIAFSPAGKPFVYGDPDSVLHPFLSHHHDLLSVDISRLNKAELESYTNHLQILRSRLISDGTNNNRSTVSFSESRVNSDFLNFPSGSGPVLGESNITDTNNGSTVSFSDWGVNSEFLSFSSGSGPVFGESDIADTNIGFVNFSDSGLNSEFLNFSSGSGPVFGESNFADSNNGSTVSFSEWRVNSEFLNFPSGSKIVGEDVGNIIDTNIGFASFSDSGLNSEFNFCSGSEIAGDGFVPKLGADFEANMDDTNANSVSFSESGVINSELVGFSSGPEVVGDDSRLWSESGIDLDFNIEDFNISELDAQIMDSDDFLNLSELGFDFEPKEDKAVSFEDGFQQKMDIGVEGDEIEAVLSEFLNEGNDNDNCLNSVF